MYEIVEFFEPSYVRPWLLKIILLYAISYLAVWAVAFILCRFRWFNEGGVILRVYFGWLVPLTVHSVIFTVFLLASAKYCKELGISLWFCVVYLVPILLSGALGIDFSIKIRGRIKGKQFD